ncbi:hypothetical protein CEXT_464041 [Caerostris extrusa]|uniref:Uncharacterized protein n=1 Tax=Caerostris extrusa TaxID=172846 RepID=A0AAV4M4Q9_CAEEX|nr:hypothetical protein CEXT_464041 [Caerostris extrusa]
MTYYTSILRHAISILEKNPVFLFPGQPTVESIKENQQERLLFSVTCDASIPELHILLLFGLGSSPDEGHPEQQGQQMCGFQHRSIDLGGWRAAIGSEDDCQHAIVTSVSWAGWVINIERKNASGDQGGSNSSRSAALQSVGVTPWKEEKKRN